MDQIVMAKKKSKKLEPTRENVVAFRCTAAYKAHLETIAEKETRTPTQVIQRALDAYTKSEGYEPFPKR